MGRQSQFYNRSMESWLQDNDIEIYSNIGKSVIAEKFNRTIKKITNVWVQYQEMTILKN